MSNKPNIKSRSLLTFKVHVPELINNITKKAIARGYDQDGTDLNQLRVLLAQVSERSIDLQDPILSDLMCRMSLYEQADVNSTKYSRLFVLKSRRAASVQRKTGKRNSRNK